MAKDKMNMEGIMKLCAEIEAKEGSGSIFSLGSKNGNLNVQRWSTEIPELDAIIGGGMPKGRVMELYGAESSGKTSFM